MPTLIYNKEFVADGSGDKISFYPIDGGDFSIEVVSIKEVITAETYDNYPIVEFLTGNTDHGKEIFFRADTPIIQIQDSQELYSNILGIVVDLDRGSQMKTFISLDDKPFYQLAGTVTKGVSILKGNSSSTNKITPALAQAVQISYRDSSKQLCRINQMAIITLPTPIDFSQ
jgi:hypothetical protein